MLPEPRLRVQITAIWILAVTAELVLLARLVTFVRAAGSGVGASAIGFAILSGLVAALGVVVGAVFVTRLARREYHNHSRGGPH
jgi:hypothetical protein